MHCLYCDRPLALLKRLTGDSEFCSKEHRKIYQKEHNQLALARLLESQPNAKGKPRPSLKQASQAKPAPDRADFISEIPGWAGMASDARRPADPLFRGAPPSLGRNVDSQSGSQPRTAGFLNESGAAKLVPGIASDVASKIRLAGEPVAGRAK